MKTLKFLPAVLLLAGVVMLASCGTSREYGRSYPPPPPPRTGVSLIISSYPGIVVNRHPSGGYYYRDPRGYTYWRGYDNRYYLDRRYMNRSYYNHQQYNDWKRYDNNYGHSRGRSRR